MTPDIALLFQAARIAKSVAYFIQLAEATDKKVERLCSAPYNSARRALLDAETSQTQVEELLRDGQRGFREALSLERGSRLASAYLGLAMCQHHLGDRINARRTLEELGSKDFTDRGMRIARNVAKGGAIGLAAAAVGGVAAVVLAPVVAAPVGVVAGIRMLYWLSKAAPSLAKGAETVGKGVESIIPLTDEQAALTLQMAAKDYARSYAA